MTNASDRVDFPADLKLFSSLANALEDLEDRVIEFMKINWVNTTGHNYAFFLIFIFSTKITKNNKIENLAYFEIITI